MSPELQQLRKVTGLAVDSEGKQPKFNLRALRQEFGEELTQEGAAAIAAMSGRGIGEVIKFCFSTLYPQRRRRHHDGPLPLTPRHLQIAMRRFVAVAWLLHSEMLVGEDGQPMSLDQLGKLPQLDCTKCALSLLAQRFGNQFNFQARVQKSKTTKAPGGTYARAAKIGWEKRRAREAAAK